MPKLDENKIIAIIQAEMSDADTGDNGTLQQNREESLDYYLGNLPSPPPSGRSKVVSTDVSDAIEWILPQIMESLTAHGSPVAFDPVSPQDENQAELETDFSHHVFMSDNEGFLNLMTAVKTALMQKNGIWKIYYDDTPTEKPEQYDGLSFQEVAALGMTPEVEVVEVTGTLPDGSVGAMMDGKTFQEEAERVMALMQQQQEPGQEAMLMMSAIYSANIVRTCEKGEIAVECVAPENFVVSNNHRSSDLRDARFTAHKMLKTRSDLIQEGYDPDVVMNETREANIDYEREQRFTSQGETTLQNFQTEDPSQKLVEVTECFMNIDVDCDGVAELMKVTVLGDEDVYGVLDMEPIEEIPFVSFSAINMPFKHWGLSVFDRLKEIQDAKTSLWRNTLDNVYLQNNREKEVVEGQVNLDDLLISRPGGIKRVKQPNMIRELMVQPIGTDAMNMMNYFDAVRTGRVGVSPDTQGQDLPVGNETAHGIERLMTAKEKLTGLMIRVVAETGLKPAYRLIRDLLVRHKNTTTAFLFRDQWIQVDPQSWGERSKMSVKVGTGTGDDMRKQSALTQLMQMQATVYQVPGQAMVSDGELYKAIDDWCDASGLNGALGYFVDPNSPQGQEQKQQAAQEQQQQSEQEQQIQQMVADAQQKLAQAEQMKAQADLQSNEVKMQSDIMKANYERQIDELKAQLKALETSQELEYKYAALATEEALKLTAMELDANKDASAKYLENKKIDNQGKSSGSTNNSGT